MFNTEPQETWTRQEADEFERHAAARLRKLRTIAAWAGGAFFINLILILPLLAGWPMHGYTESIRPYLLPSAFILFGWFFYRLMLVYGSWQSSRDTRREFGNPK